MNLDKPFLYLLARREELENLKTEIEISNDPTKKEMISLLTEEINAFKEAEKAVIHARTIDRYIRDTLIYPYSPQRSMQISRRLIAFISANRHMFLEDR